MQYIVNDNFILSVRIGVKNPRDFSPIKIRERGVIYKKLPTWPVLVFSDFQHEKILFFLKREKTLKCNIFQIQ